MRDQDHSALARAVLPPTQGIHPEARLRQRVGASELRDQRVIAGMQPVQDLQIACEQLLLRGAERTAARVRHEHGRNRHMPPPEVTGADAEIILFTVPLGEHVLPQQADFLQALVTQIEAKAMPRRDLHHPIAIGAMGQSIEPQRGRFIGEWIGSVFTRVAEDAGAIGKRRRGADIVGAVRRRGEPLDPAWRDQCIAVQQDDIAVAGGADPTIRGRGKPAISRLAVEHDPIACGQLP